MLKRVPCSTVVEVSTVSRDGNTLLWYRNNWLAVAIFGASIDIDSMVQVFKGLNDEFKQINDKEDH